jgi:hypothetical protein
VKTDLSTGLVTIRRAIIMIALIAVLLPDHNLFSNNVLQKPTRQSSIDAFSKGDYELAYREFTELLVAYPKDPLYKYYSGVCLIKLNREPGKALTLISQSQQGSAMVRTVPSDALFFLGRAQQMSGKFTEAIGTYNSFAEISGKKIARDLGIQEYIRQCNERKGQVPDPEVTAEVQQKEKITEITQMKNTVAVMPEVKLKSEESALPGEYDRILSEALKCQFSADSLNRIAENQKKILEKLSSAERSELKIRITENENMAASFQKKADQKYSEAQIAMDAASFTGLKNSAENNLLKTDSSALKSQPAVRVFGNPGSIPGKDTSKFNQLPSQVVKPVTMTVKDSTAKPVIKTEVARPVNKPPELYSVFEIIDKPVYSAGEKVLINPVVPPGLIYRIQVAVFRNPIAPSYFKGITPVYGFKVAGADKTNYYAGMFRRLPDAGKALVKVRQKGFKDAFIVCLSGGKAVSAERAAILEKEWGKKPFKTAMKAGQEYSADTIPPALSFRVEMSRALKPLKEEVIEEMKKLAGTRELVTETLSDGTVVYMIGEFITFESADEYAGLLTRNGYRGAKVTAWLGKKEMPVETARKLFERLE